MPAIPISDGRLPTPKLAIAEPGHKPDKPQPNPKIMAPIIVLLVNVLVLFLNMPPNMGVLIIFGMILIVKAVTAADPPRSNNNPKSFNCKKLNTISCFDMPPKAKPKPNNIPPTNTITFCSFKGLPPDFEQKEQLIFQLL